MAALRPEVDPYIPEAFSKAEYIVTDAGNRVSRKALILGSQNITVGGKTIIQSGAVIRGDLRRSAGVGAGQAALVSIGKYGMISRNVIIRPPYKTYKGAFNYYPVKVGDNVHIGQGSIIEAASIGSNVHIGKNCVIGRFVIIKDCVQILDDAVVPANAVIPPFSVYGGNPAQFLEELPESFPEAHEEFVTEYFEQFRVR
ncbi:dynactin subunit P25 [Hyaloraphidium curvatum]|nr:dynactin subunit P25 [Hyaloraphidium curvatum]